MRKTQSLLLLSLAFLACEKNGTVEPPSLKPIADQIAWQTVVSDSRMDFSDYGFRQGGLKFDPAGKFGLAANRYGKNGYRTTDGGLSWNYFELNPSRQSYYNYIVGLYPISQSSAYIQLVDDISRVPSLFRTDNGGVNWNELSLPTGGAIFLPVSQRVLVWYLAEGNEFWISTDAGSTWQVRNFPEASRGIAAAGEGTIIAVTSLTAHLIRSADYGVTWASVPIDTTWKFFALINTPGSPVVAQAYSGNREHYVLFRSEDSGITWQLTESPTEWNSVGIVEVLYHRAPRWFTSFYVGNQRYVHYGSDDDGKTWWRSQLISNDSFYRLLPGFAPPDWKIGIFGSLTTVDGGKTWKQQAWSVSSAVFPTQFEVFAVSDSMILRGTAP